VYRRKLERLLRKNGIRARSWSFIGHSGAACCLATGMFDLRRAWPRIRVWASADGCYQGSVQAAVIKRQYGQTRTKIINACQGYPAYKRYRAYERTLLTPRATKPDCDARHYKRCRRHPRRPWFSYETRFRGPKRHSQVVVELFKTIVFREFPSKRRVRLARLRRLRKLRRAKRRRARRTRRKRRVGRTLALRETD
jgi:hypothetical protein